jgi:hypothetical protein
MKLAHCSVSFDQASVERYHNLSVVAFTRYFYEIEL